MSGPSRIAALAALLRQRIVLLDGATGTALAALGLTAKDYGGEARFGCHEALVLQRPDAVLELHRSYLKAGADIVETDTFGATPVVLAEYGLARALQGDQPQGGRDRAQGLRRVRGQGEEALALRCRLDRPHHQVAHPHRRHHLRRACEVVHKPGRGARRMAAPTCC